MQPYPQDGKQNESSISIKVKDYTTKYFDYKPSNKNVNL